MTKTYIANTEIGITVKIGERNTRLAFTPTTGGGSVFITDNAELQKILEKHARFGTWFKLEKAEVQETAAPAVAAEPKKKEIKTVKVNSIQEAKDYLVDELGISRTMLNTKAKILTVAKTNYIQFDGIEEN